MARKKLGIVSSYGVDCGNASYTHVLKEEFSKYYDVEIITVNFRLLGNAHPKVRDAVKKHLKELAEAITKYDYVNIQFELGLFGHSVESACRNIVPLIKAARNLSFTVHRLHNPILTQPLWKSFIKNGRRIMNTLREYNLTRQYYAFANLMEVLSSQTQKGHPTTVIVHTLREKELLRVYYNVDAVIDFPITFLNKGQIEKQRTDRAAVREKVCAKYSLDPAMKYVGIFGFLAENKAHHVAINALRFLPDNYRLLIFGAQHPMSIKEYDLAVMVRKPALFLENNNAYISSLIKMAEQVNSNGDNRIRFMGNLNDPDFIDALTATDFVVLPYYETGQSGSGNASLVIEVGSKAILARNHAFLELSRYYTDCYEFADIGNAPEIAQRILFWNRDLTGNQERAIAKYNIENNIAVQAECFENGIAAGEALKQRLLKQ